MADSEATVEQIAKVEQYGAYHLVTWGVWQVTVDNAGMIRLPAVCSPDSGEDFIGAFEAALPVARKQQQDNAAAQRQMSDFVDAQRAQLAERNAAAKAAAAKAPKTPRKAAAAHATQARRSKVGGPRGARKVPPKKATDPVAKVTPIKKAPAKKVSGTRKRAASGDK
jgi:hypothetical protein